MTTIKAYTTVEQSRKLAEILPPESADMYWDDSDTGGRSYTIHIGKSIAIERNFLSYKLGRQICAWSLASLLNYLREIDFFPKIEADELSVTMNVCYYNKNKEKVLTPVHEIKVEAESFVDACYEMIIRLNELNLL